MSPGKRQSAEFQAIFERHRPTLRAAIQRVGLNLPGFSADDIEQEVAVKLWSALESGREIDYLPSYISTTVRNVIIDLSRRAANRQAQASVGMDDAEGGGPEFGYVEFTSDEGMVSAVEAAMNTLTDDQRIAVKLKIQGFTAAEVAKAADWSPAKAESATKRGLKALRQTLKAAGIEYEPDND